MICDIALATFLATNAEKGKKIMLSKKRKFFCRDLRQKLQKLLQFCATLIASDALIHFLIDKFLELKCLRNGLCEVLWDIRYKLRLDLK